MSRPVFTYELVMKLWPLTKVAYKLGKKPVAGSMLRTFFSPRLNHLTIVPVNETISTGESLVLPYFILDAIIEQASHCFIMKECMCRRNEGCQSYPHNTGCLFLGDGAALINPSLGSLSTKEMALAHVRSATKAGLVPLVAHTVFDSALLGIPHRRMLTICFCCECCCTVRHGLRLGPPALWDVVMPLPGLYVESSDECTGCGTCIEICPVGAISLSKDRSIISAACKGCGRCVPVCPMGAINMNMRDRELALHRLWEKVSHQTAIGANSPG